MQPSGSKDSLPEEANLKKSQETSKLSRRSDALNKSIEDSEISPTKNGKSPTKIMRKGTLLKGNRMKQQQSMYGEDGSEPKSPNKNRRTSSMMSTGEERRV